jgi:UV DNA damage endonuclease
MQNLNLGYACINETLKLQKITTNRGLKKATLNSKGLSYASQLALQNVLDLEKVMQWNVNNNIKLFRMSSDVIPWGNKIDITQLPDYTEIKSVLARVGAYANSNKIRITTHPGPFNLLASSNPDVVKNTVLDLEMHARVFDMMGLSETHYNKINIHVGAVYNDKIATAMVWCNNFKTLPDNVKNRLTIENDDKASMYSVLDLYKLIHSETNVPIVFDYHHHGFNTGDLNHKQALELAMSTWPKDIKPMVHYSESKSLHENDPKIRLQAHSNFINGPIDTFGYDVDIMLETKAKELALLKFRDVDNYGCKTF